MGPIVLIALKFSFKQSEFLLYSKLYVIVKIEFLEVKNMNRKKMARFHIHSDIH
jgi:hypothetical protein